MRVIRTKKTSAFDEIQIPFSHSRHRLSSSSYPKLQVVALVKREKTDIFDAHG